jgi:hypothetical protein
VTVADWLLALISAEGLVAFLVILAVFLKVRRIERALNGGQVIGTVETLETEWDLPDEQ